VKSKIDKMEDILAHTAKENFTQTVDAQDQVRIHTTRTCYAAPLV
jgi:hypothetical protein